MKQYSIEKFNAQITKTETCWIWTGYKDAKGYGRISFRDGKRVIHIFAHRFSYSIIKGDIPKGMNICHKCDNPICVNPEHLFIGTTQDNVNDRVNKNRSAKGIKNGTHTHPETRHIGSTHKISKLKERDILVIKEMAKAGLSHRRISKLFDISRPRISQIIKGIAWKHVA